MISFSCGSHQPRVTRSGRLSPAIRASSVTDSLPSGERNRIFTPVFSVMASLTVLPPQTVLYQLILNSN